MRFFRLSVLANLLVGFLLLSSTAGCMPVPYVFPHVTYVPPLDLGRDKDQVCVFRVDTHRSQLFDGSPGCSEDRYTVDFLPKNQAGGTDTQFVCHWDSGCCLGLLGTQAYWEWSSVRLYRPGYQTIEISGVNLSTDVTWLKAMDLAAQETAVDKVWSCPEMPWQGELQWLNSFPTQKFLISPTARGFLASEYERLAQEQERLLTSATPNDKEGRERLLRLRQKAAGLRNQVAERNTEEQNSTMNRDSW
jgi:hypothetical protein